MVWGVEPAACALEIDAGPTPKLAKAIERRPETNVLPIRVRIFIDHDFQMKRLDQPFAQITLGRGQFVNVLNQPSFGERSLQVNIRRLDQERAILELDNRDVLAPSD